LETIPGAGFITATAIAATATDPSHFRSSREFAAWLGLTPRQNSSGGKERLGRVSKMGNAYLRSLIVVGVTAMIRYAREKGAVSARWINTLLEKKPARLVSDLNQDHPRSGKDLGVEISFGEWMMAFGFAQFVIASLLFEYA
jgi:transposase